MKTLVLPGLVVLLLGCAGERSTRSAPTLPAPDIARAPEAETSGPDSQMGDAPASEAAARPSADSPMVHATAPSVDDVPVHMERPDAPVRLTRADKSKGQRAWNQEGCDSCHGGGRSASKEGNFIGRIPNPLDSDKQVERAMRAVREGVNDGRLTMPAHPRLDDATLLNLLAYARSLSRR